MRAGMPSTRGTRGTRGTWSSRGARGTRGLPRAQRATTLVEMLAAMAAGLLVLSAMVTMFATASAARNELDRATQQLENGRLALDLLREDIHMAGFYGGHLPAALQMNEACVPRTGVAASGAVLGWGAAAAPMPIQGYAYGDVPASETCFTNQKAGTDVLIIRSVDADAITVAAATSDSYSNDLLLQVSSCANPAIDPPATPTAVAFGGEGAAARLKLHDADCVTLARVRKLVVHAWYVGRCSVCSGGADTIPTLRMIELTGTTTTNSALVEGIESMRVEYAIDRDGDGVADAQVRCKGSVDACSASDWKDVIAVQVHLLARSTTATPGHVDRKTYDMGLAGVLPPFGDGFRRHRYSSLAAAYNRLGPRER
jgi:type IV pilus assembly protein PilW